MKTHILSREMMKRENMWLLTAYKNNSMKTYPLKYIYIYMI